MKLYRRCWDGFSGGWRHLPRAGGVLDQDQRTMALIERVSLVVRAKQDEEQYRNESS